ncbi:MAG TPA: hypothetical protein VKB78_07045, partial [Pirellulales bacterium]|nr:hypothetical protein [Pirellulales bacterium]
IEIGPHGPNVHGGLIVNTGNETDELKTALEQIEKVLSPANAAAAQKWHRLPSPPNGPQLDWGFQGSYLIVGVGMGSADSIAVRATSKEVKPPEWYTALRRKLPVERPSTVFYLNAKKVREAAAPVLGDPETKAMLDFLGIGNIRSVAAVSGLDGAGCLSKTWIETDTPPSGLLAVFGPESLKAADLAPIPKDSSFAAAAHINSSKVFGAVLEGMKKIRPDLATANAAQLAQTEAMLGFGIKKDLLDMLGDTWCIYNSPGEGGLMVTGLTLVVPVKDRGRLAKTTDRLLEFARQNSGPAAPTIKETKFGGQRIFYLVGASSDVVPFIPAWCISDTHLILSLSPQNIRAFLSRDRTTGSLADVPAVAERLKSGNAVLITYQDTAGMLKITYPVLQILATLGFSELGSEGIDLDSSVLPSLASVIRHVEPGIGVLVRERDGLTYTSRQSLPLNLSLPVLFGTATVFGFELPMATPIPPPVTVSTSRPQAVP